jgi:hypothetical protein
MGDLAPPVFGFALEGLATFFSQGIIARRLFSVARHSPFTRPERSMRLSASISDPDLRERRRP